MTTNSSLASAPPQDGSLELEVNSSAFGRYFDRPEVQRAYKEQQIIQTPEFTQLTDDAAVGGRFRPRGSEEVRRTNNFPLFALTDVVTGSG